LYPRLFSLQRFQGQGTAARIVFAVFVLGWQGWSRWLGGSLRRDHAMSNRKLKKPAPVRKPESKAVLRDTLTKRKKAELVAVLMDLAQEDRGILRQLTARFDVPAGPDE